MTVTVAAPAPEDDDADEVVERALCRCGRLARVVLDTDEDGAWCSISCACGAFAPVGPEGGSR